MSAKKVRERNLKARAESKNMEVGAFNVGVLSYLRSNRIRRRHTCQQLIDMCGRHSLKRIDLGHK
jgi:hypothetical protein